MKLLNKLIEVWNAAKRGRNLLLFVAFTILTVGTFYSQTVDRLERVEKVMNQSEEIRMSFRVSPPRPQ